MAAVGSHHSHGSQANESEIEEIVADGPVEEKANDSPTEEIVADGPVEEQANDSATEDADAVVQINRLIASIRPPPCGLSEVRAAEFKSLMESSIMNYSTTVREYYGGCYNQLKDLACGHLVKRKEEVERITGELRAAKQELQDTINESEIKIASFRKELKQANQTIAALKNFSVTAEAIKDAKSSMSSAGFSKTENMMFFGKLGLEIVVSVLEPLAASAGEKYETYEKLENRDHKHLHFLQTKKDAMIWTGLFLCVVILLINFVELFMTAKREEWCSSSWTIKWRRVSYIPGIYGIIIAIMEIVLYACAFAMPWSLHIALFACVFGMCLMVERLVKIFSEKKRLYELNTIGDLEAANAREIAEMKEQGL